MTRFWTVCAFAAMLIAGSRAMERTMQEHATRAFQSWSPSSVAISYNDAPYNDKLVEYLREQLPHLKMIEVSPSRTHRHFVVPLLNLNRRYKLYGMQYSHVKVYFAAFRAEWEVNTAVLDDIGSVNGVNQVDLYHKMTHELPAFTAHDFGLTLHVP